MIVVVVTNSFLFADKSPLSLDVSAFHYIHEVTPILLRGRNQALAKMLQCNSFKTTKLLQLDALQRITNLEALRTQPYMMEMNYEDIMEKKVAPMFVPPVSSTLCFSLSLNNNTFLIPCSSLPFYTLCLLIIACMHETVREYTPHKCSFPQHRINYTQVNFYFLPWKAR